MTPKNSLRKDPSFAVHFKNAAAKAKFSRGEMTPSEAREATIQVPIIRGVNGPVAKQYRNDLEYAAKLADPVWQENAKRIREDRAAKKLGV